MPTPPYLLHLLHVEDDADDVELLQDAFKDNGINVITVVIKEGDKVIPYLSKAERLPDVIVMDLNLPKIHGKEILITLRKNIQFNSISVVILSTSSSKEDNIFCLQNGADQFIIKPSTALGFKQAVELISAAAKK